MSKVICDVCGTAYPETAATCPICGYAKASAERTAAVGGAQSGEDTSSGYTYVKGGRFSKKNVRKRNQKGRAPERVSSAPKKQQDETDKGNLALIIIVILLLIAIIAVVIYIGVRVFGPDESTSPKETGSSQTTQGTQEDPQNSSEATVDNGIPCESLQLSNQTIEFIEAGDNWTLQIRPTPENTTDEIVFKSSDPNVVTVDEEGNLVAVGSGMAIITVTCGDVTQECQIKCSFGNITDPTGPSDPDVPEFEFAFNTKYYDESTGKADTTMEKQGETWRAYKSDLSVDPSVITWISDDPTVCTVENGIVTAVGPGKTEVHAQYAGKTYTCVVRCSFTVEDTGDDDDQGTQTTVSYKINKTDVSIAVDETFTLTLKNGDGNVVDVTWTAEDGSVVSINGNKITGAKSGTTNVSTTYEGVTYTCIVRVK